MLRTKNNSKEQNLGGKSNPNVRVKSLENESKPENEVS